ncbi:hypothetical protein [Pararhodobacter sp. CCB-MM2]|uniref:TsoY family (seleno)protein n=1 Tax=Pararhodobacter sp. CCB-MM2 TaxID=1786003 RepID=UPI00082C64B8|nr:hypothetical protein [Pararhodobacter sp. CCB-MM2]
MNPTRPSDTYSPMYFLSSLGAGGLSVTFFMWLMFWVPHPGRTVPIFEDILAAFQTGSPLKQAMILGALAGIALFVVLNLKSLIWNLSHFSAWKRTEAYQKFLKTNAQSQLMALPLALAMSVNGLFIAGLVFVPGLWNVVEYLFPLALTAFVAIAVLAFRLYGDFLGRIKVEGGFNHAANNSFGQILPAFAFAMVGVGMAAPAAMSASATVVGLSIVASTFLMITAALIAGVALILGIRSMLDHGTNAETAPTLMILIPLMTILGILMMRQSHGLGVQFENHSTDADTFLFLARMVSIQVVFALFGWLILSRHNYGKRFLWGRETSVMSYALVCPGVGFVVLMQFFIHKGLVAVHLVDKFSPAYWALVGIALAVQAAMIGLVFVLNRRHFGTPRAMAAVPAE